MRYVWPMALVFLALTFMRTRFIFIMLLIEDHKSQDVCTNIGVRLGKGVGWDGGYIDSIEAV